MNGKRNKQRTDAASSRPLRDRLHASVRILLIVAILVAGWFVGRGFAGLFAEWRQPAPPKTAPASTDADFNSMAAVLPLAGQWSFAELEWSVKSHLVTDGQLESRFETLATPPATNDAEQLPDVPQELLDLVELLRIRPTDREGNLVYRFDRPDSKAQLVTREVAGRPKLVAFAAVSPHDAQQWQLLEITPRGAAAHRDHAATHLLPLPAEARRSGGRFADDGQLLLELIALDSNADELITLWKAAGWEVRPSGLGGPNDFSYLCARGEEVVYAWSANHRAAMKNLMLVRAPSQSDTNP